MKINFPLLALAIGALASVPPSSPRWIAAGDCERCGRLDTGSGNAGSVRMPSASWSAHRWMTLLLSHRARRNALIFLMGIFTVGNLLSSIAPDYTTLLLSRIITSLNHGAFFGLGSVVAASVVPKHASRPAR